MLHQTLKLNVVRGCVKSIEPKDNLDGLMVNILTSGNKPDIEVINFLNESGWELVQIIPNPIMDACTIWLKRTMHE